MKPGISMITLGFRDLATVVEFHEQGPGLPRMDSLPVEKKRGNSMKRMHVVLAALLVLVLCGSNSFAHVTARPLGGAMSKYADPHAAVHVFLEAVDRGELVVFGRKITQSMIVPVRVVHEYDLENSASITKIFSRLKEPMAVPGQKSCTVHEISATFGENGRITESEAHIDLR
jgi:hypothetical protein